MNMQWHYLYELFQYSSRLNRLAQIYQDRHDTLKAALYAEKSKHFSWTTPTTDNFIYGRDGRSFFTNVDILQYMEALGLTSNHYYTWVKDYLEAEAQAGRITKFFPITDESEWAKIAPTFRPELQVLNDSVKKKMAQMHYAPSKIRVIDFSNVPADQVIKTLKERYKGNTVLIDCWATWCGPCRMGIKAMQPLEREMEGKKVVFVYVTDESSPLEGWKETINTMPGDHIRLTSEQFAALPTNKGIPAYLMLDPQGNEILSIMGWAPANIERFRQAINKALVQ